RARDRPRPREARRGRRRAASRRSRRLRARALRAPWRRMPMARTYELTLPELALSFASRAAAGAGIAFLLARRLSPEQRRVVGWSLIGAGTVAGIATAAKLYSRGALCGAES